MLMTYVGGPNDGLHEIAHEAPDHLVVVDKDGQPYTYQRRTNHFYAEAVLSWAVYVPPEMTQQEFMEAMRGVKPPPMPTE